MTPVNAFTATWAASPPVAQDIPDPSEVGTGTTGTIVLILLILAVLLLLLSLRKQLRKADRHFASDDAERDTGADGVIGDSGSTTGGPDRDDTDRGDSGRREP